MTHKTFCLVLLTGMLLSACGGQATRVTETPIPDTATATLQALPATSTATETPANIESPTPSPTATEFVPTNPADCINSAAFVADVTIPDNSDVIAGVTFTKTWRIRNSGTCTWWSGYKLTYYSEEQMGAPDAVPLQPTNPGDALDISVELTAPTKVGAHRGNFVIKNPAGLIIKVDNDSRLWVLINSVSEAPMGTQTSAGPVPTNTPVAVNTTPATPAGTGFANVTCAYTSDTGRAAQVIQTVNAYRAEKNLPAYKVNDQLNKAAQAHANDMACNQLFGHAGSNGSNPQTRVTASGYSASAVTENVYGSYPPLTGEQVVMWWQTDQTDINHNKNLLSSTYTDIGVAYAFFDNFGYYVIVFAAP